MREMRLTALTGATEAIQKTAALARLENCFLNLKLALSHTCEILAHCIIISQLLLPVPPGNGSFPDKLTYNMLWEHCYFRSTFSI